MIGLSCVKALAPGGRIVFYGGTAGAWPEIQPAALFFKQGSIMGSTMGSPSDFKEMLDFLNEHKIIPVVSDVFKIDACTEAFKHMEEGKQAGKIVFDMA